MWKKVIYIGIAVIIGIAIFFLGYNSNQMNHLLNLVNDAITNERYHEVPMIWEGCFDTNSIVEKSSDDLDIVIYPATSQVDVTYNTDKRYLKYEKAYYVYIFNAKFTYNNVSTGSDSSYNKTSMEFSNGTETYPYYFVADSTMNSSSYVANPTTVEDAVLKNQRNIVATFDSWNFMKFTLTETMAKEIQKELGGEITKITLKDSTGESKYTADVNLNFSQNFFSDLQILFDNYNTYLDAYLTSDEEKIKEATNKFNEFYEPWYEEFNEKKEQTGYTFRYDDSYLAPGKLIWQTVGIEALYLVVVEIFYIILFHFKSLRRIFSRGHYKDYSSKGTEILVNGKWVKTGQANKKHIEEKPVEESIESKEEDNLEVVTVNELLHPVTEELEEVSEHTSEEDTLEVKEPEKEDAKEEVSKETSKEVKEEETKE